MRVLMTADAVGGVWTYAMEAADALADQGASVTLAVMGGQLTAHQRRRAAASALEAVHESTFALEWMDDPWDDVDRAGRWLLDLAGDVQPDVVHLNGYAHAALPWPAPVLVVAHSCVFSWWAAVRAGSPPGCWDEYRRRVTAGLDAAAGVVAPTAAMLGELRRWYGFDGGRVIPNGRSAGWAVPAVKEPFVLGAGRVWDEGKNLALLDAVAERLDGPVVLAGDLHGPSGRFEGLRFAHPLGALPFDDLAVLLGRAAIFAHPARYEPFGLSPLEAALSGCALVLGDIPSLREVWGDAAAYVHPDDEERLTTVLGRLLADPARAAARGAAARRRADAYRPEAMAAAYVEAYRALAVRSGSPR